jgi:hypothetical protein
MRTRAWHTITSLLVAVCAAAGTAACGTDDAAPAAQNERSDAIAALAPKKLVATARRRGEKQRWVRVEGSSTDQDGNRVRIVQDSGPRSGRQTIRGPGFEASMLLVDGVAYVRANAAAQVALLGLPERAAPYAGTWIQVPASDPVYPSVVEDVTIGDMLAAFDVGGPLTKAGPITVDGAPLMRVSGEGRSALYISADRGLPVSMKVGDADGDVDVEFSRWRTRVDIQAPANAVPISSLR